MTKKWTGEDILKIVRGFQPACVLAAGAELDIFGALADGSMTAGELAARIQADPRGLRMLADALVAMELLNKEGDHYAAAPGTTEARSRYGIPR